MKQLEPGSEYESQIATLLHPRHQVRLITAAGQHVPKQACYKGSSGPHAQKGPCVACIALLSAAGKSCSALAIGELEQAVLEARSGVKHHVRQRMPAL